MSDVAEIWDDLSDKVDKEGVATLKVQDGMFFVFSVGHLERMLERANSSPRKKIAVFVKTDGPLVPPKEQLS